MVSLKSKTRLLGLIIFVLPALVYWYWLETKQFIVSGQSQAQMMMAQSLASLVSAREDLLVQVKPELAPFFTFPSNRPKKIDGNFEDWEEEVSQQTFGEKDLIYVEGQYNPNDLSFSLSTAETPAYFYLLVKVTDDKIIHRSRKYLRIDASDHLRLEFIDANANLSRYILTAYNPGVMSAYATDENWKYASTGQADERIFSASQLTNNGYQVEIRLPKDYLHTSQKLSLALVDVDQTDLQDRLIIGTYPQNNQAKLNRVFLRSPQMENLLTHIGQEYGRVWIIDKFGRIRGESGKIFEESLKSMQPIEEVSQVFTNQIVQEAFKGEAKVAYSNAQRNGSRLILASAPIHNPRNQVIGAVFIEQAEEAILVEQKKQVFIIMTSIAVSVLVIYLMLYIFSQRLVRRITQLENDLNETSDSHGRLQESPFPLEKTRDELGRLRSTTATLLQNLQGYTSYLERMPKVLRHELHNPLHVIHSALFNLEESNPKLTDDKYLKSAHRGLDRLDELVESFTQASSLEDALEKEETEIFDLLDMVQGYITHREKPEKNVFIQFNTDLKHLPFVGNDFRIEQMLDKVIDNAVSFADENSVIIVSLSANDAINISVSNDGPLIENSILEQIFEPMMSHRDGSGVDNKLHLGVGLYIAQKIAKAHKGNIQLINRADGLGVTALIQLQGEQT